MLFVCSQTKPVTSSLKRKSDSDAPNDLSGEPLPHCCPSVRDSAAGGLLQLGVQLLHQHPQLRWQPQHLHNPNPNHTPLHQNTYRRTGQGKHNNNFTVYSTICSKLTT